MLTRVGGRFALTATGVGLVLLAHAPVDVQEEVLSGPIKRFTSKTVTDPVQLRRMLADVRSNGFSVSDRQVTMDSLSVGAPITTGTARSWRRCPWWSATAALPRRPRRPRTPRMLWPGWCRDRDACGEDFAYRR